MASYPLTPYYDTSTSTFRCSSSFKNLKDSSQNPAQLPDAPKSHFLPNCSNVMTIITQVQVASRQRLATTPTESSSESTFISLSLVEAFKSRQELSRILAGAAINRVRVSTPEYLWCVVLAFVDVLVPSKCWKRPATPRINTMDVDEDRIRKGMRTVWCSFYYWKVGPAGADLSGWVTWTSQKLFDMFIKTSMMVFAE